MAVVNELVQHEFVCKCGVNVRVDVEVVGLSGFPRPVVHCDEDVQDRHLGRTIRMWEERDGTWTLVRQA